MMKHALIALALAPIFLAAACSNTAKYDDVKTAMEKEIAAVNAFVAAAATATDSKSQAAAINDFVDQFKPALKEANTVMARHTELQTTVVDELKPLFIVLSEKAMDSAAAVQNIKDGAFAKDPEVVEALARMTGMAGE